MEQPTHIHNPEIIPHGDGYMPKGEVPLKDLIDTHRESLSEGQQEVFNANLAVIDAWYGSLSNISPAELSESNKEYAQKVRNLVEGIK
jgi:hypothetical protein